MYSALGLNPECIGKQTSDPAQKLFKFGDQPLSYDASSSLK